MADNWLQQKVGQGGSIVLHAGGRFSTRDEIRGIPCPDPVPGERFFPISHSTFLDCVESAISANGLTVTESAFAISQQGHRLFGIYALSTATPDWSVMIGVRQATDRSMAAGMVAGERVFACDNLAFSSTLAVIRRHTKHILRDLPDKLSEALALVPAWVRYRHAFFEALKLEAPGEALSDSMIVQAFRDGILSTRDLRPLLDDWGHKMNRQQDDTPNLGPEPSAYELYNSFTSEPVLGRRLQTNPARHAASTMRLQSLFVRSFPDVIRRLPSLPKEVTV